MSNGGTTTSSATNTTPIHGGATSTHQRRRVADAITDREKENSSDYVNVALDHAKTDTDSEALYNVNSPLIRYPSIRRRVPENWVLCVKECVLSVRGFLKSLTLRKHMGRMVFVILLMMVAFTAYLSFFFLLRGGGAVADGGFVRTEKETTIIRSFKNDFSSNAQKAVFDSESSSSSAVQKRRMREFPVSLGQYSYFLNG